MAKDCFEVTKIKFVKTGTYFPPSHDYTYNEGWNYEQGGLDNEKTHKILELDNGWPFAFIQGFGYIRKTEAVEQGWIEAKNVEKIF